MATRGEIRKHMRALRSTSPMTQLTYAHPSAPSQEQKKNEGEDRRRTEAEEAKGHDRRNGTAQSLSGSAHRDQELAQRHRALGAAGVDVRDALGPLFSRAPGVDGADRLSLHDVVRDMLREACGPNASREHPSTRAPEAPSPVGISRDDLTEILRGVFQEEVGRALAGFVGQGEASESYGGAAVREAIRTEMGSVLQELVGRIDEVLSAAGTEPTTYSTDIETIKTMLQGLQESIDDSRATRERQEAKRIEALEASRKLWESTERPIRPRERHERPLSQSTWQSRTYGRLGSTLAALDFDAASDGDVESENDWPRRRRSALYTRSVQRSPGRATSAPSIGGLSAMLEQEVEDAGSKVKIGAPEHIGSTPLLSVLSSEEAMQSDRLSSEIQRAGMSVPSVVGRSPRLVEDSEAVQSPPPGVDEEEAVEAEPASPPHASVGSDDDEEFTRLRTVQVAQNPARAY